MVSKRTVECILGVFCIISIYEAFGIVIGYLRRQRCPLTAITHILVAVSLVLHLILDMICLDWVGHTRSIPTSRCITMCQVTLAMWLLVMVSVYSFYFTKQRSISKTLMMPYTGQRFLEVVVVVVIAAQTIYTVYVCYVFDNTRKKMEEYCNGYAGTDLVSNMTGMSRDAWIPLVWTLGDVLVCGLLLALFAIPIHVVTRNRKCSQTASRSQQLEQPWLAKALSADSDKLKHIMWRNLLLCFTAMMITILAAIGIGVLCSDCSIFDMYLIERSSEFLVCQCILITPTMWREFLPGLPCQKRSNVALKKAPTLTPDVFQRVQKTRPLLMTDTTEVMCTRVDDLYSKTLAIPTLDSLAYSRSGDLSVTF